MINSGVLATALFFLMVIWFDQKQNYARFSFADKKGKRK